MTNLAVAENASTSSADTTQVMSEILSAANKVVPSDLYYVILFTDGYAQVAYRYGIYMEKSAALEQQRFAIETVPQFRYAVDDKAPYLVRDTETAAAWTKHPINSQIGSSLGMPIESGGKTIGMLTANSIYADGFQPADMEKLRPFAHYAGLALRHADYAAALEGQVVIRTRELQAAKEQVEAILNHSRDGIILVRHNLTIIKSNRIFAKLFLSELGDGQGRSLLDFIHPEDGVWLQSHLECTRGQEQASALEIRAYRNDGRLFEAELGISPLAGIGLVCTLRDITDRKARHRHLQYLASIQENVTDAVIVTDLTFRIQSWNKAAEAIYGWSAGEVIGKTTLEIFNQFDAETQNREQIRHTLITQGHWQGEIVQYRKDGIRRDISGAMTLLRDARQAPFCIIAICRDVTECNEAAATLAESRRFVAQIAEVAPDTIYIFDIEAQRNIYSNRNIAALLGYAPEEIKEMGNQLVTELLYPEDRARFVEHMDRLRATQNDQVVVFTYRMRHKDGAWRWLESHDKIFRRNGEGKGTQIIGVVADITERKNTEDTLRKQYSFLQQVIDNVPNLILVKDQTGHFQLVNGHTAHIYGLSVEEMLGKTDTDVNPHEAEVAFFRQKDQEALASGKPIFIPEQPILGTYYQTSKIPLMNEAGVADRLLIVSVDVSLRKETETALQQALQSAKELSELKSSFITTTSHEFRTPLAIILAITETLSIYRHQLTGEQIEDRLTKIRRQIEHLKTLLADVIEVARIQERRVRFLPVPLSPHEFCHALVAEFQEYFAVTHQLIYAGDAYCPQFKLDKQLMRQIVTNLLSNAIKYSPVDKPIWISLAYCDGALVLVIQDEGIGIPATDIKHLFQPFYRATNVGTIPGTGLGLIIAKEAVELHGGSMRVESQLKKGTTFTVRIPGIPGQSGTK